RHPAVGGRGAAGPLRRRPAAAPVRSGPPSGVGGGARAGRSARSGLDGSIGERKCSRIGSVTADRPPGRGGAAMSTTRTTRRRSAGLRVGLAVCAALLAPAAPAAADPPVFPDVPGSHAFAVDISWGAAAGLVDGYGDGTFRPAAPVSRQ